MGGRHSSQNSASNHPRGQRSLQSPSRHSVSSLEAALGNSSRGLGQNSYSGVIIRGHLPTDLTGSVSPDRLRRRRRRQDSNDTLVEAHSLPAHLFPTFLTAEVKCPVCHKRVASDQIESHLFGCLSKPRITYNEDTLVTQSGECSICFDDMNEGDKIARLPCLCIYHKRCIDDWFQRNRCCPEHPDQIPQDYVDVSSTPSESSMPTLAGSGPLLDDSPLDPDSSLRVRFPISSGSFEGDRSSGRHFVVDDHTHEDLSYPADCIVPAEPDLDRDSSLHEPDLDMRLLEDPDIANLSSKIRRILVLESPNEDDGISRTVSQDENT